MRTSQMLFLIIIFPVVSGCAWRSFFFYTLTIVSQVEL